MKKRENELKSRSVEALRKAAPSFVVQVHQQIRHSGTPDISVDGNRVGSWWEFKHATPGFESHGLQELTCLRLAAATYCRYIIFYENADGVDKRTLIVHPKRVHDLFPEAFTLGHDHAWIAEFIKKVHKL